MKRTVVGNRTVDVEEEHTWHESLRSAAGNISDKVYETWMAEGKIEINNLVWKFLPGNTTLDDADMISTKIYDMIDGWWEFKRKKEGKL